eukprot:1105050-Pleurochrysis_carterae.AAC.1
MAGLDTPAAVGMAAVGSKKKEVTVVGAVDSRRQVLPATGSRAAGLADTSDTSAGACCLQTCPGTSCLEYASKAGQSAA